MRYRLRHRLASWPPEIQSQIPERPPVKSVFHLGHSTQILAATVAGLLAAHSARAASGTWTTNGGGLWSDTTKWSGGTVADGFGNTANFASLDLTADATVHLDSGRTLDAIMFGDTAAPLQNWTVDNNGNAANFFGFGSTTSTLAVTVNSGTATISADIGSLGTAPTAGGNVLSKNGSGKLILSGQSFLAGDVNANLSALFMVEGGGELAITGSLKAASSLQSNRTNGVNLVGQTSAGNVLALSGTGTVVVGSLAVGADAFGGNSVTISSPGTLAAPSWLMLGNGAQLNMGVSSSNNTLTLSNGAYFRQNSGGGANTWTIGTNAGANNNSLVVTGTGSTLDRGGTAASFINIGAAGSANSLTVSAGGTLRPRRLAMGSNGGDNNSVVVTGAGSTAVINEGSNSAFEIGSVSGSNGNSMTISAGGSFSFTGVGSRSFSIGKAGDSNSLSVTGSGSSLVINYTLPVGVGGNVTGPAGAQIIDGGTGNHLDLYNGGTMTSNTPVYVLGTSSTFNLGDGTSLGSAIVGATSGFIGGVFIKNADGRLRFNNGRLTTGADGALVSGAGQIALDGPAYVSTTFAGSTISTPISGSGSLTKEGAGTLTLSGSNTYSGDTTVNLGTLSISAPYLADNADIRLASGGFFHLNTGPAEDTIRALFIDGVPQATGIWGALGSGAAHESSLITGSGRLMVTSTVPEPSSILLLLGCGIAGLARRRR